MNDVARRGHTPNLFVLLHEIITQIPDDIFTQLLEKVFKTATENQKEKYQECVLVLYAAWRHCKTFYGTVRCRGYSSCIKAFIEGRNCEKLLEPSFRSRIGNLICLIFLGHLFRSGWLDSFSLCFFLQEELNINNPQNRKDREFIECFYKSLNRSFPETKKTCLPLGHMRSYRTKERHEISVYEVYLRKYLVKIGLLIPNLTE